MPPIASPHEHPPARRFCLPVMVVLWLIYFGVSWIAYTDHGRVDDVPPLNAQERQGLALWRSNNCQACHQIYGFGGFLGPDLTNQVTEARDDEDFEAILTVGEAPMPAFEFDADERSAILAYLRAVNRTGTGQLPPLAVTPKVSPLTLHRTLLDRWAVDTGAVVPAAVTEGLAVWETNACGACHIPFALGTGGAVDHLTGDVDLAPDAVASAVARGPLTMPRYELSEGEVENLSAMLTFLREQRDGLRPYSAELIDREPFRLSGLPWWEYGR